MDAVPSATTVPSASPPQAGAARRSLLRLITATLGGGDENAVLWAAMAAVAAIGPFTALAPYAVHSGLSRRCPLPQSPQSPRSQQPAASGTAEVAPTAGATVAGAAAVSDADLDRLEYLDRCIDALDGSSRRLDGGGGTGEWAIAVCHQENCLGYLVVRALAVPSAEETDLALLLAQQTGIALAGLAAREGEPGSVQDGPQDSPQAAAETGPAAGSAAGPIADLGAAVSTLASRNAFQSALLRTAASGEGEQGILGTLHDFTGLPASTEDLFGNVRAWAGPRPQPDPPPRPQPDSKPGPRPDSRRNFQQASAPGPVREQDRLVVPVEMAGERLGSVVLAHGGRPVAETDVSALEAAALALAPALFHERKLMELVPQLRRDLVEKLISGTESDGGVLLAATFGHDLSRPHRVVVLRWAGQTAVGEAVARVAGHLGLDVLIGSRGDTTVALVAELEAGDALYRAVSDVLGNPAGAVGVGGRCSGPEELPRSFDEAVRALTVRSRAQDPHGSTDFEELGLYRMMGTGQGEREADRFVREWLGPLLGYDDRRHTDLVTTLSHYLESGGSYDTTSRALHIHRSTVRYRLQRIREITGYDLADVETRLNLHVATRVRHILHES